jgi:stearoyl-CoA desaturase (delta-9 desaturase)
MPETNQVRSAEVRKRPPLVIRDAALRPRHRSIALATVWVPFLGTVAALALLPVTGFGGLEIGLMVGGFVLTTLGIEGGLHRSLAHRAFQTHQWIRNTLAVLGSMAAEGRLLHWVADHRRHHAHSDTSDDPHSPRMRHKDGKPQELGPVAGLWHAHIGHMLMGDVTNCTLFARDINRDPTLRKINDLYGVIVVAGFVIPTVIGWAATGTWVGALSGFLWGGMVRMFLVHHTTWSVASFAHRFGASPFDTGDYSANNLWLALPSFGSSLQNNHHAFPRSAYLGLKWWEIDVAGGCITLMKSVGLAWKVRQPSREEIDAKLTHPPRVEGHTT